MRIIGFNIESISAKRNEHFSKSNIDTNIQFKNVEKEKIDFLKDEQSLKITFSFSINYKKEKESKENPLAEVLLDGSMLLAVNQEEFKEFTKAWKKKEVPQSRMLPLYNFILKKCSVKAISLEEDLSIPTHIPFPQLTPKPQQDN